MGCRIPKYNLGGFISGAFGSGSSPGFASDLLNIGFNAAGSTMSNGSDFSNTAKSVLSGAGMGASFGPIGMAVGGGLGLLKGLIDIPLRKSRERKDREALQAQRGEQLESMLDQSAELGRRRSVAILQQFPMSGVRSAGYYALGGELASPYYEVEEGEVVQGDDVALEDGSQLASDVYSVGGSSHEYGGTMGSGGDRIFSDRIKVPDSIYEKYRNL